MSVWVHYLLTGNYCRKNAAHFISLRHKRGTDADVDYGAVKSGGAIAITSRRLRQVQWLADGLAGYIYGIWSMTETMPPRATSDRHHDGEGGCTASEEMSAPRCKLAIRDMQCNGRRRDA